MMRNLVINTVYSVLRDHGYFELINDKHEQKHKMFAFIVT